MTIRRKIALVLSAVAALAMLIYFTGPKTNYTGMMKLIYNTGYLLTFCPGRKIVYSGHGIKFSFLAFKGMELEQETDKSGETAIWLNTSSDANVGIYVSNSMPEIYKKTAKGIAASKRIPAEIKAKIAKEGINLDTLPWIIAEDYCRSYRNTLLLAVETIKRVTLKNGLQAVTFVIHPDPMAGGSPSLSLVALGPNGQLCEIIRTSTDFTEDFGLFARWRRRNTLFAIPPRFPSPSIDKQEKCQFSEIANSLEFK